MTIICYKVLSITRGGVDHLTLDVILFGLDNLCVMSENSQGCLQDYLIAQAWQNISCANENIHAADARGNIATYLTCNEVAKSQRKSCGYMRGNYEATDLLQK